MSVGPFSEPCEARRQSPQQAAMPLQPILGAVIIGADLLDLAPKTTRMVHLPQVHQFVENDVVAHISGRLDKTPVERNGLPDRTRAPTRTLAAHHNAANC